jgi:isocitrate dehydrogenase
MPLLRYLGWPEAASLVRGAVEKTIKKEILTIDLHAMIPGSTLVSTSEFGDALVASMRS